MKMNMIAILVTIIILIFLLRRYEIRIKGYLGEWYVSKKLNIPLICTVLLEKNREIQSKLRNKNIFFINKLFNRKTWME